MTTPFERFFAEEFKAMQDAVEHEPAVFTCPEYRIEESSWDRKAAFLLWIALDRPDYRPVPLPGEKLYLDRARDVVFTGITGESLGKRCEPITIDEYWRHRKSPPLPPKDEFEDLLG